MFAAVRVSVSSMMRAAGSLRPVEPTSSIEREGSRSPRWKEDLLPLATILILTLIYNWILLSHYYGYVYAYHDLALITDWFTNALYHSKPFWISEDSVNHLSIHFTPTLVLLIPLYLLSDSSYLLVLLGTLALAASLYLGHRWWMALSRTYVQSVWVASAVSAALAAFIALNAFTKTILDSAHIEIFYIPLFLGFAYSLRFHQKVRWAVLLCVLALGMREEAGLYLCLQTLALLFLPGRPAVDPRRFRNRALFFSGCALLYTMIAVKIIFPYFFGIHETSVERGWSEWGNSWLQVTLNILTSPKLLFHHLEQSSFERLNRSFGYLPWLNPAMAALVNAPGLLLYTASHPDKRLPWFIVVRRFHAGVLCRFLSTASLGRAHSSSSYALPSEAKSSTGWRCTRLGVDRLAGELPSNRRRTRWLRPKAQPDCGSECELHSRVPEALSQCFQRCGGLSPHRVRSESCRALSPRQCRQSAVPFHFRAGSGRSAGCDDRRKHATLC